MINLQKESDKLEYIFWYSNPFLYKSDINLNINIHKALNKQLNVSYRSRTVFFLNRVTVAIIVLSQISVMAS